MNALHIAASNGLKQITQALLKNGVSLNSKTKENVTPLHLSSQRGHVDIVNIFLSYEEGLVNAKDTV